MKKLVLILILSVFANHYSHACILVKCSELKLIEQHSIEDINLKATFTSSNKEKVTATNTNISNIKSSHSVPNELLNLYPLAIGNKWVYLVKNVINPNVWYKVGIKEVIGDSIAANGKLYYHLKAENNHYLYRIDSTNSKVYRYYQNSNLPENEYTIADLEGKVGDSITSFDPSYPNEYSYIKISQIDTISKWGLFSIRKIYKQITPDVVHVTIFALTEGLGRDSILTGLPLYGIYSESTLKGCVINGVVYGDTTLTSIDDMEESSVTNFKLEQNYPNPFNPSTKISWQSPVGSWQTLKVYDVLGNEVATLVNEYKTAGSYEVEFNSKVGSHQLANGVYFYQLKAGDPSTYSEQSFVETKKMILLK